MMQPLKALNNVQKARLLHTLYLQEIPGFLNYTVEVCLQIAEQPEELRGHWENQILNFDFWVELSKDTHFKILKYGRQLEKSSALFGEQLFDGYGAIFLSHCLHIYTENDRHSDPKFKAAVELFFNP